MLQNLCKTSLRVAFLASLALVRTSLPTQAQENLSNIIVPESSIEHPEDIGVRAHTNFLIRVSNGLDAQPDGGLGPGGGMTPAQIRSFYSMPASGGSGVIAIVDAFHYPTALNDFNAFSNYFGLPKETSTNVLSSANQHFQITYATGSPPATDSSGEWELEEALDIEWAHAMAPNAKIVLVEAASNSFTDLFQAVSVASSIPNVKQVSMSWAGGEFSSETSYDSYFNHSSPVYYAATGDNGAGTAYPSVSPYVVACGGTHVNTNAAGNFVSETGWSGSGGGRSVYEARPFYQNSIANIVGVRRGVPDISSDADPNTGVSVYDTYLASGWYVLGGTSVSAPCIAGMTNLGGSAESNSVAELTLLYGQMGYWGWQVHYITIHFWWWWWSWTIQIPVWTFGFIESPYYRDILSGSNGYSCTVGWDFVTGIGAPLSTNSVQSQ